MKTHWNVVASLALVLLLAQLVPADDTLTGPVNGSGTAEAERGLDQLIQQQEVLAERFASLETKLFTLADFEAASNPTRAALLRRAVQLSNQNFTHRQMDRAKEQLSREQLQQAIESQQAVVRNLKQLLDLLLSEDRPDRIRSEQQRLREYIRELQRLERLQADNRGRTERGADMDRLAEIQQEIADRTGALERKIAEDEGEQRDERRDGEGDPAGEGEGDPAGDGEGDPAGEGEGAEGQDGEADNGEAGEGQAGDGEPGTGETGDGETGDGETGDGEGAEGDAQEGSGDDQRSEQDPPGDAESDPDSQPGDADDASQPGDQQPGDQQPGDQHPGDPAEGADGAGEGEVDDAEADAQPMPGAGEGGEPGEPSGEPGDADAEPMPEDQNPARRRLREAEERMEEAKQQLEEARRDESVESQRQAEERLREAIAEFERILRQLREEEIERMLAMLESRFARMLKMQLDVYEDTKRLDAIPQDQRDRNVEQRAANLAFEERKIVLEADRALTLLREEGSSLAFPETVEHVRDDMQQVADRLADVNVGRITQGIQEDIIQSLEEMIEALQQAQHDLEQDQPDDGTPGEGGDPGDQPLVDQLAELKMIRALQMRVNTRTRRYALLLDDMDDPVGQATDADLQQAIQQLAEREERIFRITRDIVLGRNR